MSEARVIDVCCGSRMMWFDKADPRAIFGDRRSETLTVTDRSHREDGRGHEHFVVTSAKAEAALYELDEWLAAAPQAPAHEAPAAPIQHQGMTIAGNGAAELGKLMREQRDSRMGIYPDGNPNSGQP